ncbi:MULTISPECIES: hypothetical protein [Psychrobacter]|uniref:Uncharacterized protein n=1 Tax=Psychrobacter fozii TaxID=198480 RepID=A0A2V4VVF4_9GAMM|nr:MULTISPECIES: hypothetical protein [Psychrobacter]MBH0064598.1 hypothetical protein [Psychrobacter sp. SZ93C1]PYE39324.1 hypothetical protein DFP82_104136 [Psychrobacter fozii]
MQLSSPISYKCSANATTYRDGGSLELRFTADDDRNYCIFMEVVHDSPNDCKRYHPPLLFKDSFDINNSKPEDFIDYLTWQQIKGLISEIRMDIGQDFEKHADCAHLGLIENIANNNGWLIES